MQYTNIKRIADKLMRHPLMNDITFETIVDYTIDFMRIIGTPNIFIDKIEDISIKKYKGKLPCDLYQIILVEYKGVGIRYTTDTFHLDYRKPNSIDWTFKVLGDYIFTSFEKGLITISYKAIEVDEDGFPKIPDNSNFMRALEAYIKLQHFTILFDTGKINAGVYLNAQQDYYFYVGSCIGDMNMITISEAESFYNSYSTLIQRTNEFKRLFRNNGSKEYIKQH